MVIGIKGGLKVGKDAITETVIEALNAKGIEAKNRKFADKLKDIVCQLINCTREELEDRDFKTTPIGPDWVIYRITGDYDYITKTCMFPSEEDAQSYIDRNWKGFEKSVFIHKEELTPRKLLQLIGTEGGRDLIHPNIWCNALFSEYEESENWVISDVRFPNEKKIIERNGGIVIEITRPFELRFPQYAHLTEGSKSDTETIEKLEEVDFTLYETLNHASETILDGHEFKYTIVNDGTLDELREKVLDIMKQSGCL